MYLLSPIGVAKLNSLVYVPVSISTKSLIDYMGKPDATYRNHTGNLIGLHYLLNQTAIEKLQVKFGKVFEVIK